MKKLYVELENSNGRKVHLSDNDLIVINIYALKDGESVSVVNYTVTWDKEKELPLIVTKEGDYDAGVRTQEVW